MSTASTGSTRRTDSSLPSPLLEKKRPDLPSLQTHIKEFANDAKNLGLNEKRNAFLVEVAKAVQTPDGIKSLAKSVAQGLAALKSETPGFENLVKELLDTIKKGQSFSTYEADARVPFFKAVAESLKGITEIPVFIKALSAQAVLDSAIEISTQQKKIDAATASALLPSVLTPVDRSLLELEIVNATQLLTAVATIKNPNGIFSLDHLKGPLVTPETKTASPLREAFDQIASMIKAMDSFANPTFGQSIQAIFGADDMKKFAMYVHSANVKEAGLFADRLGDNFVNAYSECFAKNHIVSKDISLTKIIAIEESSPLLHGKLLQGWLKGVENLSAENLSKAFEAMAKYSNHFDFETWCDSFVKNKTMAQVEIIFKAKDTPKSTSLTPEQKGRLAMLELQLETSLANRLKELKKAQEDQLLKESLAVFKSKGVKLLTEIKVPGGTVSEDVKTTYAKLANLIKTLSEDAHWSADGKGVEEMQKVLKEAQDTVVKFKADIEAAVKARSRIGISSTARAKTAYYKELSAIQEDVGKKLLGLKIDNARYGDLPAISDKFRGLQKVKATHIVSLAKESTVNPVSDNVYRELNRVVDRVSASSNQKELIKMGLKKMDIFGQLKAQILNEKGSIDKKWIISEGLGTTIHKDAKVEVASILGSALRELFNQDAFLALSGPKLDIAKITQAAATQLMVHFESTREHSSATPFVTARSLVAELKTAPVLESKTNVLQHLLLPKGQFSSDEFKAHLRLVFDTKDSASALNEQIKQADLKHAHSTSDVGDLIFKPYYDAGDDAGKNEFVKKFAEKLDAGGFKPDDVYATFHNLILLDCLAHKINVSTNRAELIKALNVDDKTLANDANKDTLFNHLVYISKASNLGLKMVLPAVVSKLFPLSSSEAIYKAFGADELLKKGLDKEFSGLVSKVAVRQAVVAVENVALATDAKNHPVEVFADYLLNFNSKVVGHPVLEMKEALTKVKADIGDVDTAENLEKFLGKLDKNDAQAERLHRVAQAKRYVDDLWGKITDSKDEDALGAEWESIFKSHDAIIPALKSVAMGSGSESGQKNELLNRLVGAINLMSSTNETSLKGKGSELDRLFNKRLDPALAKGSKQNAQALHELRRIDSKFGFIADFLKSLDKMSEVQLDKQISERGFLKFEVRLFQECFKVGRQIMNLEKKTPIDNEVDSSTGTKPLKDCTKPEELFERLIFLKNNCPEFFAKIIDAYICKGKVGKVDLSLLKDIVEPLQQLDSQAPVIVPDSKQLDAAVKYLNQNEVFSFLKSDFFELVKDGTNEALIKRVDTYATGFESSFTSIESKDPQAEDKRKAIVGRAWANIANNSNAVKTVVLEVIADLVAKKPELKDVRDQLISMIPVTEGIPDDTQKPAAIKKVLEAVESSNSGLYQTILARVLELKKGKDYAQKTIFLLNTSVLDSNVQLRQTFEAHLNKVMQQFLPTDKLILQLQEESKFEVTDSKGSKTTVVAALLTKEGVLNPNLCVPNKTPKELTNSAVEAIFNVVKANLPAGILALFMDEAGSKIKEKLIRDFVQTLISQCLDHVSLQHRVTLQSKQYATAYESYVSKETRTKSVDDAFNASLELKGGPVNLLEQLMNVGEGLRFQKIRKQFGQVLDKVEASALTEPLLTSFVNGIKSMPLLTDTSEKGLSEINDLLTKMYTKLTPTTSESFEKERTILEAGFGAVKTKLNEWNARKTTLKQAPSKLVDALKVAKKAVQKNRINQAQTMLKHLKDTLVLLENQKKAVEGVEELQDLLKQKLTDKQAKINEIYKKLEKRLAYMKEALDKNKDLTDVVYQVNSKDFGNLLKMASDVLGSSTDQLETPVQTKIKQWAYDVGVKPDALLDVAEVFVTELRDELRRSKDQTTILSRFFTSQGTLNEKGLDKLFDSLKEKIKFTDATRAMLLNRGDTTGTIQGYLFPRLQMLVDQLKPLVEADIKIRTAPVVRHVLGQDVSQELIQFNKLTASKLEGALTELREASTKNSATAMQHALVKVNALVSKMQALFDHFQNYKKHLSQDDKEKLNVLHTKWRIQLADVLSDTKVKAIQAQATTEKNKEVPKELAKLTENAAHIRSNSKLFLVQFEAVKKQYDDILSVKEQLKSMDNLKAKFKEVWAKPPAEPGPEHKDLSEEAKKTAVNNAKKIADQNAFKASVVPLVGIAELFSKVVLSSGEPLVSADWVNAVKEFSTKTFEKIEDKVLSVEMAVNKLEVLLAGIAVKLKRLETDLNEKTQHFQGSLTRWETAVPNLNKQEIGFLRVLYVQANAMRLKGSMDEQSLIDTKAETLQLIPESKSSALSLSSSASKATLDLTLLLEAYGRSVASKTPKAEKEIAAITGLVEDSKAGELLDKTDLEAIGLFPKHLVFDSRFSATVTTSVDASVEGVHGSEDAKAKNNLYLKTALRLFLEKLKSSPIKWTDLEKSSTDVEPLKLLKSFLNFIQADAKLLRHILKESGHDAKGTAIPFKEIKLDVMVNIVKMQCPDTYGEAAKLIMALLQPDLLKSSSASSTPSTPLSSVSSPPSVEVKIPVDLHALRAVLSSVKPGELEGALIENASPEDITEAVSAHPNLLNEPKVLEKVKGVVHKETEGGSLTVLKSAVDTVDLKILDPLIKWLNIFPVEFEPEPSKGTLFLELMSRVDHPVLWMMFAEKAAEAMTLETKTSVSALGLLCEKIADPDKAVTLITNYVNQMEALIKGESNSLTKANYIDKLFALADGLAILKNSVPEFNDLHTRVINVVGEHSSAIDVFRDKGGLTDRRDLDSGAGFPEELGAVKDVEKDLRTAYKAMMEPLNIQTHLIAILRRHDSSLSVSELSKKSPLVLVQMIQKSGYSESHHIVELIQNACSVAKRMFGEFAELAENSLKNFDSYPKLKSILTDSVNNKEKHFWQNLDHLEEISLKLKKQSSDSFASIKVNMPLYEIKAKRKQLEAEQVSATGDKKKVVSAAIEFLNVLELLQQDPIDASKLKTANEALKVKLNLGEIGNNSFVEYMNTIQQSIAILYGTDTSSLLSPKSALYVLQNAYVSGSNTAFNERVREGIVKGYGPLSTAYSNLETNVKENFGTLTTTHQLSKEGINQLVSEAISTLQEERSLESFESFKRELEGFSAAILGLGGDTNKIAAFFANKSEAQSVLGRWVAKIVMDTLKDCVLSKAKNGTFTHLNDSEGLNACFIYFGNEFVHEFLETKRSTRNLVKEDVSYLRKLDLEVQKRFWAEEIKMLPIQFIDDSKSADRDTNSFAVLHESFAATLFQPADAKGDTAEKRINAVLAKTYLNKQDFVAALYSAVETELLKDLNRLVDSNKPNPNLEYLLKVLRDYRPVFILLKNNSNALNRPLLMSLDLTAPLVDLRMLTLLKPYYATVKTDGTFVTVPEALTAEKVLENLTAKKVIFQQKPLNNKPKVDPTSGYSVYAGSAAGATPVIEIKESKSTDTKSGRFGKKLVTLSTDLAFQFMDSFDGSPSGSPKSGFSYSSRDDLLSVRSAYASSMSLGSSSSELKMEKPTIQSLFKKLEKGTDKVPSSVSSLDDKAKVLDVLAGGHCFYDALFVQLAAREYKEVTGPLKDTIAKQKPAVHGSGTSFVTGLSTLIELEAVKLLRPLFAKAMLGKDVKLPESRDLQDKLKNRLKEMLGSNAYDLAEDPINGYLGEFDKDIFRRNMVFNVLCPALDPSADSKEYDTVGEIAKYFYKRDTHGDPDSSTLRTEIQNFKAAFKKLDTIVQNGPPTVNAKDVTVKMRLEKLMDLDIAKLKSTDDLSVILCLNNLQGLVVPLKGTDFSGYKGKGESIQKRIEEARKALQAVETSASPYSEFITKISAHDLTKALLAADAERVEKSSTWATDFEFALAPYVLETLVGTLIQVQDEHAFASSSSTDKTKVLTTGFVLAHPRGNHFEPVLTKTMQDKLTEFAASLDAPS